MSNIIGFNCLSGHIYVPLLLQHWW